MRFAEKLLLSLSRKPGSDDYQTSGVEWNIDDALSLLSSAFPDFMNKIKNKKILDFGCGEGYQSVAMASNGAKYVLGIDASQKAIKKARDLAIKHGYKHQAEFKEKLEESLKGSFDIIISQNSMEHFTAPVAVINGMKSALNQDGRIMLTFACPWFAPYGSHMHFFTKVPWVNILFSEKTVMKVRTYFRDDGATKYEEVESGLNKMTVKKFERIISDNDLEVVYKKYDCAKGINFLGKIPLIRELFINRISCVIAKRSSE